MNAAAATQPVRSPRAPRAPVPSLPPLDALDRTHHQMLLKLAALQQLVDRLDTEGAEPAVRRSAQAICQFFDGNARQHHADEETLVFPALVRKGDKPLIQRVLRLQQDHGWLEEDWLALAPQLHAVARGHSGVDTDALRHAVGVFTTLYHEHIALEESMIYPEARAQLAAEASSRDQRVASTQAGTPAGT
ncbi:MAG: hemerythrin domain-containing protein [Pseudomonadota bacterium]